jgi:hypothetical protein
MRVSIVDRQQRMQVSRVAATTAAAGAVYLVVLSKVWGRVSIAQKMLSARVRVDAPGLFMSHAGTISASRCLAHLTWPRYEMLLSALAITVIAPKRMHHLRRSLSVIMCISHTYLNPKGSSV